MSYDAIISQKSPDTSEWKGSGEMDIVASDRGGKEISCGKASDASRVITEAVLAIPDNGSLFISAGVYELSADTVFYLDGGDKNPFWVCIPVLDGKNVHLFGAGVGATILRLRRDQHGPNRPVVMILSRATSLMDPGFTSFTVANMTLDGNKKAQKRWLKDGSALVLTGSQRKGGRYHDLELINSYGSGLYLGNNGSGWEENSCICNVVARNCEAEGVIIDTCRNTRVLDCAFEKCGTGLTVHGNIDYQSRGLDRVRVDNVYCIQSPLTIWCINDLDMEGVKMDVTACEKAYGLLIHSSIGVRIKNSMFRSSRKRANSYGGASYIDAKEDGPTLANLKNCFLSGYFALHGVGSARITMDGGALDASYACAYFRDVKPTTANSTLEGVLFMPSAKKHVDSAPGTEVALRYCHFSTAPIIMAEGKVAIHPMWGIG